MKTMLVLLLVVGSCDAKPSLKGSYGYCSAARKLCVMCVPWKDGKPRCFLFDATENTSDKRASWFRDGEEVGYLDATGKCRGVCTPKFDDDNLPSCSGRGCT